MTSIGFYEFDSFQLNVTEGRLYDAGKLVPLTPKVFQTLLLLIERRARIVTKEEIIAEIWRDSFVEENSLARNISLLRKALGDNQPVSQFIETVSKRGYKFIAVVRQYADEPAATKKNLAVLPFKVIGDGSDEQQYLGLGIADALITKLSGISQLIVRPTRAVQNLSEDEDPAVIGAALRVEVVLDGRIMRFGDALRVTVQLTGTANGETLWGEKFDEQTTNIFEVLDSIAERVTDALLLKLTSDEQKRLAEPPTQNTAAYREYLAGRFFLSKRTGESLKKAVGFFQNSVAADSRFKLAHLGLADCYLLLPQYHGLKPLEAYSLAKDSAQTALKLDANCAEAFISLGYANFLGERNWAEAEKNFQKGIRLKPNYATGRQWYAFFLTAMGRFDEALSEIRQAQFLDPLSPIISKCVATITSYARRHEEAIQLFEKCLDLEPNFAQGWAGMGLNYVLLKEYDRARAALERAVVVSNREPLMLACLAQGYAAGGEEIKARGLLAELLKPTAGSFISPFDIALIYLELEEYENVYQWLETSIETHDYSVPYLNVYPDFARIRPEPRYQDLLCRVNLI